jgi:hypothetical protein
MIDEELGQEAFNLLCGKKIGSGMSRQVYECKLKPGWVVKVETDPYPNFQNLMEWQVWKAVQHTKFSRWFAACDLISPDGKLLIQERTRHPATTDFPDKVPAFFTDLKRQNFGMTTTPEKNWFVAHDYGVHLLFEKGLTGRLVKANWWDES